jgi:pyrroline-5-carboxylate reductase
MIGFIGGGNMAEAIISGLKSSGKKDIILFDTNPRRLDYMKEHYNVKIGTSNQDILNNARLIVLAVKPQHIDNVLDEIKEAVSKEHLFVSIAAGISISYITEKLGTERVVRVMPNTPALVREGMSVLTFPERISKKEKGVVLKIFQSIGRVIELGEQYMDAVTALSGSGPAFFAHFIESMVEAGVRMGIPYEDSLILTIQTAIGTIRLLESGKSTFELKKMVTSPGGTTAEGLFVMDHGALKAIVKDAIEAATIKSRQLSRR